jgi:D-alanyl-D-alanine carboxypeptidase/D-alanyl-D-alanine-endopeptidase (penicillin-binding protein 4)
MRFGAASPSRIGDRWRSAWSGRRRRLAVFAAVSATAALTLAPTVGARSDAGPLESELGRELDRALTSSGVPRNLTGAVAFDLSTGETVYVRNPRRPLVPASNQKLAVTVAALVELGPGYRFETLVEGTGEIAAGVLHGDLVLLGSGDPTLGARDLELLAQRLHASGLRRITGHVVGDATLFDELRAAHGWKRSFLGDECAPLSALTVEQTLADDPARETANRFRTALAAAGIEVRGKAASGAAPPDAVPLAGVVSEPLSRILRQMNRESDNFVAEMLVKAVGAHGVGRGTTRAGVAVVRRDLRELGVGLEGARLLDGSGLSYGDRLTAETLGELLVAVWADSTLRKPFVASLAVAGLNGTLDDRLVERPARGRVRGKTGTTSIASTLAGFVGDRFAFAVLMNGDPVPTWSARAGQDRFVQLLAAAE